MRAVRFVSTLLAGAALAAAARTAGAQEAVDFSRYVAVGDGYTAGVVNGSLFDGESAEPAVALGQKRAWPALLAKAMNKPLVLPLISHPGPPGMKLRVFDGICTSDPGAFAVVDGTGGRIDPSTVATNVAVPGQTIHEALVTTWSIDPNEPSTIDSLEDLILGLPHAAQGGSPRNQIETAVALDPTFVTLWLGNENALRAARETDPAVMTSREAFAADLQSAMSMLPAGDGVVASVVDVTALPFFIQRPELRQISAFSDAEMRTRLGVRRGGSVTRTPETLDDIAAIVSGQASGPLTPEQILTLEEARAIRGAIRHYNRELALQARNRGFAYVDLNRVFRGYMRRTVTIGSARLAPRYLGGFFDVEGIHPSNTGHAVIAAAFVKAIRDKYGVSIAAPNFVQVTADDPLLACTDPAPTK